MLKINPYGDVIIRALPAKHAKHMQNIIQMWRPQICRNLEALLGETHDVAKTPPQRPFNGEKRGINGLSQMALFYILGGSTRLATLLLGHVAQYTYIIMYEGIYGCSVSMMVETLCHAY